MSNPPRRVIAISSTGIDNRRDIPVTMIPLYHWLLAQPHADKKNMEKALLDAGMNGKKGEMKEGSYSHSLQRRRE